MLEKLLKVEDRVHLARLSILIAMSDSPVERSAYTNQLVLVKDPLETELIEELIRSAGKAEDKYFRGFVERELNIALQKLPLEEFVKPESRLKVARSAMQKSLEELETSSPSVPKIMLYDLIHVALRDGSISDIQMALLRDFQHHHQIQDFIFDEIMERAQALVAEVNKAISLVME